MLILSKISPGNESGEILKFPEKVRDGVCLVHHGNFYRFSVTKTDILGQMSKNMLFLAVFHTFPIGNGSKPRLLLSRPVPPLWGG